MAHAFDQYDPEDYSVIFNGIPLEGFAEDDCIDIEFDSEGYQDQVGADGRVVRYKSNDQRSQNSFLLGFDLIDFSSTGPNIKSYVLT